MSIVDDIEEASDGRWSRSGCTHPHSVKCHAAFDPDCPTHAALNDHIWVGRHTGWAVYCKLEPCISSPWIEHLEEPAPVA